MKAKCALFLLKACMYIAVAFILYCVGEHFKRPGADNPNIETATPEW